MNASDITNLAGGPEADAGDAPFDQQDPFAAMGTLAYHGMRSMFGGGRGGGGGAVTPPKPAKQPKQKPEDVARAANAGVNIDPMQAATAGFEAGAKHDKLSSVLDSLGEFFGTLGGNPQVVQTAQMHRQQRIDAMANAAQTHALAAVGQQKLAEERQKQLMDLTEKTMSELRLAAPDTFDKVDPQGTETAQAVSEAMQGNVARLAALHAHALTSQGVYAQGKVGTDEAAKLKAQNDAGPATAARKGLEATAEADARNASENKYARDKAKATAQGGIDASLALSPEDALRLRTNRGQVKQGGAGGGKARAGNVGSAGYGKETQYWSAMDPAAEAQKASLKEGWTAGTAGYDTAVAEHTKLLTGQKAAYFRERAKPYVDAVSADTRNLQPDDVHNFVANLDATRPAPNMPSERDKFARPIVLMAKKMIAEGDKERGQAILDAINAAAGGSAATK